MQEILARGGKVILITDKKGDKEVHDKNLKRIVINNMPEFVQPIILSACPIIGILCCSV